MGLELLYVISESVFNNDHSGWMVHQDVSQLVAIGEEAPGVVKNMEATIAMPILQAVSDAAWYRVNIPTRGMYDVYAWWPANSGYNNRTPYVISTTTGNKTVHVDQRYNGGKWNHFRL